MNEIDKKPVVFHIDDDDDFLELFAITFDTWLEIESFNDTSELLARLEIHSPDVIVTDFEMSDYNGLELLNIIRQRDDFIPVILYTGQGNEEIAREAFISGATDYFTKDLFGFAHKEKFVNVVRRAFLTRKSEMARRQSEAKYKLIFNNISDVYYEADERGILLEISPSIKEVSKYNREELLGCPLCDFYEDPSQRDVFLENLKINGYINDYEIVLKDKDGRGINCSVNAKLLTDKNGNLSKVVGSIHDITDRKESARELEETKALLLAAIENSPAGIIIADVPDGKIRIANSAAVQIRQESEEVDSDNKTNDCSNCPSISKQYKYFPNPEDNALSRAISNGEVIKNQDVTICRPNGETRQLLVNSAPVFNSENEVIAGVAVFADVTDRIEADESLRRSESLYRSTINALSVGIHVIDKDYHVIMFNDTFRMWCNDLGLGNEFEGKNIFSICEFLDDRIMEEYRTVFETGRIMTTSEENQLNDNPITTETTKIPIFEGQSVTKVVTVIRDITKTRKAQESMKNSGEKLKAVLRAIPDLTILMNDEGIIEDVYPSRTNLFEVLPDDVIGTSLFSHLSENLKEQFRDLIKRVIRDENMETFVFSKHRNNKIQWFQARVLTFNPGGNHRLLCLIRETNDQLKSDHNLNEEQNLMAIAILQNSQVVFANQAIENLTGYPLSDIYRRGISLISKIIHPDDRELTINQAMCNVSGKKSDVANYSYRIIQKNGQIRWVEQHSNKITYNGKPADLVSIIDTTEHKKSMETLCDIKEKQRLDFESFSDIIFVIDTTGRIIDLNLRFEEESGCSRKDVIGKNVLNTNILTPESIYLVMSKLAEMKTGKEVPAFEVVGVRNDGNRVPYQFRAIPIKNSGRVTAIQAILRNILQQNKQIDSLQRQNDPLKAEKLLKKQKAC